MALSQVLANGIPPEYAPGGDPDDAFYAGAVFGYEDAARCMGTALVGYGEFESWLIEVGFTESVQNEIRKIYQEAYDAEF